MGKRVLRMTTRCPLTRPLDIHFRQIELTVQLANRDVDKQVRIHFP